MKKLLFVLLFLFSHFVYAVESINLEIRSNNDLIKQGDVSTYSFVVTGENLNPMEIRSILQQVGLINGLYISSIDSEDVSPTEITYKALASFYGKEIPTSVSTKVNNKDYELSIKYFSIVELKEKQDQLQVLNQLVPWNLLRWGSGFLGLIVLVALFIKRKDINSKLNVKANMRLKKEFGSFEKRVNYTSTSKDLDNLKTEAKKYQHLDIKKNLVERLNSISTKEELESIYQKRKELYVFDLITSKQLSEFENKMNKIQYRPNWNKEDIQEIVDLFKGKKEGR